MADQTSNEISHVQSVNRGREAQRSKIKTNLSAETQATLQKNTEELGVDVVKKQISIFFKTPFDQLKKLQYKVIVHTQYRHKAKLTVWGVGVATINSYCETLASIINEDQSCLNPWRWFGKMYSLGEVSMFPTLQPLYIKNYEYKIIKNKCYEAIY